MDIWSENGLRCGENSNIDVHCMREKYMRFLRRRLSRFNGSDDRLTKPTSVYEKASLSARIRSHSVGKERQLRNMYLVSIIIPDFGKHKILANLARVAYLLGLRQSVQMSMAFGRTGDSTCPIVFDSIAVRALCQWNSVTTKVMVLLRQSE